MKTESILVCGGGIAGMACALGLKRAGLGVSILAPAWGGFAPAADFYHPRVYAISAASQSYLQQLGIWDLLDSQRLTAVEAMQVYGDGGGCINLHAWQDAQGNLAWIVESGEIERALHQALRVFGVPWHEDTFASLQSGQVITGQAERLQADLLIGADGARSALREAARISHQAQPYGDAGMVAHLHTERPHQHIALQWFTGDSILALLPMPDVQGRPQVSMVWSVSQAVADRYMAMPQAQRDQTLEQELFAITQGQLGHVQVRSQLHAFPLTLERSGMVAPGVALIGDAAHRVHPLAGQGLNLGLGDVEQLVAILAQKEPMRSVGDMRVLGRYRRARSLPINEMRWATDGLYKLFALPGAPAAFVRNVGMQLVDQVPLLKRYLIAQAAGSGNRNSL